MLGATHQFGKKIWREKKRFEKKKQVRGGEENKIVQVVLLHSQTVII